MAGDLSQKAPQRGSPYLGRISVEDFILQLKELQILYGPAVWWKLNYPGRRIRIVVQTDKGKTRTFYARLSNTKLDGGHPNMVTSIQFPSKQQGRLADQYFNLDTFKKFIIGTIEKT